MQRQVNSVVALALLLCLNAEAAGQLDATASKSLSQLEQKYFGHTYPANDTAERVQRLEKLIFGEVNAGELNQRIKNMVATMGSSDASAGAETESNSGALSGSGADAGASANTDNGSGENYPHIDELERAILGKISAGQPLTNRLERLETKAFGQASANPDLSDRTDALDAYLAKHSGKSSKSSASDDTTVENDSTTNNNADQTQSDYPHVTALEKTILGQSFTGQSLTVRLTRMETKAFGKANETQDLSERADALDTYVRVKLHRQIAEGENARQGVSGTEGNRHGQGTQMAVGIGKQVATIVGNSLLGMVGVPGLGLGAMGTMAGLAENQHSQSGQQQQSGTPSNAHQDDLAIFEATPPPPESRLITKVGWCEQQIFGHTFANLHLTERLEQLNTELHFDSGKAGSQLMDRIGQLIQSVQNRKQVPATMGTINTGKDR